MIRVEIDVVGWLGWRSIIHGSWIMGLVGDGDGDGWVFLGLVGVEIGGYFCTV